ncbi:CheR family methyltransferase [Zooshikella ganghwensis]|uniref:CheR family methyltransferase n=1 Tax=Zooshikella ganghwensis TaxID=202772 RepID=UPI0004210CA5
MAEFGSQPKRTVPTNDFEVFSLFLEKSSGIVLGKNKEYLVKSRLRKILAENNINSLTELVSQIEKNPRGDLRGKVIDAMTTNETLWFRDNYPYDVLKNRILPELVKERRQQNIRIWSAACSTGQEPYSIAMAIDEFERNNLGMLKGDVKIVATDLSSKVMAEAMAGEYDSLALGRGLSDERLNRYFTALQGKRWVVKPHIKERVEFRIINLQESYTSLGRFDIVFCRNVLIYFSAELKLDILSRIYKTLKPGGFLFLGASEALNGLSDLYEMVQCRPGIMYMAKSDKTDVFARAEKTTSRIQSSSSEAKRSTTRATASVKDPTTTRTRTMTTSTTKPTSSIKPSSNKPEPFKR